MRETLNHSLREDLVRMPEEDFADLPHDLAVSRLLVISNRFFRREISALARRIPAVYGRPLSYRFLQDLADSGKVWRALRAGWAPQVFYDIPFAAFACRETRKLLTSSGLFASYGPRTGSEETSRNPLLMYPADMPAGSPFSMMGAVPSVLWVDEKLRCGRPLPMSWADLLEPMWIGDISIDNLRFIDNNMVCLLLYLLFGEEGLRKILGSVRYSVSNVVSNLNLDGNTAAVHVTLLPFVRSLADNPRVTIVWPSEGAAAGVQLALFRRDLDEVGNAVRSFLFSERWSAIMTKNGTPAAMATKTPLIAPADEPRIVGGSSSERKLFWPGWDVLDAFDFEGFNQLVREILAGYEIRGVTA